MSTSHHHRRAFADINDLLWFLIALLVLVAILLPSLAQARKQARATVCMSNLKGVMMGQHIYASDNEEAFTRHYFETTLNVDNPATHGVTWVGSMGSSDSLRITQGTSKDTSPKRGHPSRSLFLLIIGGQSTPGMFICPSTEDTEDMLRNYGSDAGGGVDQQAAQPGRNRFDFAGYTSLSYGYQLPFGPRAQPSTKLDVRMAMLADKGPYTQAGGGGLTGTRTVRDRLSGAPTPNWSDAKAAAELGPRDWRPYNSRNHNGEYQNIAFLDGHVASDKRPIAGVNHDNIYTLAPDAGDKLAFINGMIPKADESIGPISNTDSYIVP